MHLQQCTIYKESIDHCFYLCNETDMHPDLKIWETHLIMIWNCQTKCSFQNAVKKI